MWEHFQALVAGHVPVVLVSKDTKHAAVDRRNQSNHPPRAALRGIPAVLSHADWSPSIMVSRARGSMVNRGVQLKLGIMVESVMTMRGQGLCGPHTLWVAHRRVLRAVQDTVPAARTQRGRG